MTVRRSVLLGLAVLVLYALHQDFWFRDVARPLVFGFLPIGLFYHVVLCLAIAGLMWLLVRYAWPVELQRAVEDPAPSGSIRERS
jgi:hypothetical protein